MIFILLFTVVSLPTFLYFGLSNTVFKKEFYAGALADKTHDLLLNATAKKLIKVDKVIEQYFTESDIKAEMLTVFPADLFREAMIDLGKQVEGLKDGTSTTVTISMDVYRRSLLTLANNLSFKLFESLPKCVGGEIPEDDIRGLPTCVPEGVEYNVIAAPFSSQFEASVYMSVPEIKMDLGQMTVTDRITLAQAIQWFASAKNMLYGGLMLLLILIALLVYGPFSSIAKYEGLAFILSGVSGYIFCLGLSMLPGYVLSGVDLGEMGPQVLLYAEYLMSFIIGESQKIALVFLTLGVVLILVRVFMVHRFNEKSE